MMKYGLDENSLLPEAYLIEKYMSIKEKRLIWFLFYLNRRRGQEANYLSRWKKKNSFVSARRLWRQ